MATLIITESDGRRCRCTARCYNAESSKCRCRACGGLNHGIGFERAINQTSKHAKEIIQSGRMVGIKVALVV